MSQTGKLPGFEFQKDICDKFSKITFLKPYEKSQLLQMFYAHVVSEGSSVFHN